MKVFKGILYWFLSLTWGGIMTWLGLIIGFFLTITGHKPHRFHYNIYWNVGKSWGGLEFGAVFLTDSHDYLSTKQHEHGHGLQNIILGPLSPFLVSIPSGFRYWFREMHGEKKKTIYTFVTTFITLALGTLPIVFGVVYNIMWLWIIGAIWEAYFLTVCGIWQACEIPKYNKFPQPYYDAVWFENQATVWGERYFPEEKSLKK